MDVQDVQCEHIRSFSVCFSRVLSRFNVCPGSIWLSDGLIVLEEADIFCFPFGWVVPRFLSTSLEHSTTLGHEATLVTT